MATKLFRVRRPNSEEKTRGAEVVFERIDSSNRVYEILACKCCESWEQWGQITEILGDNVDTVEAWRNKTGIFEGSSIYEIHI
jgi:hypothetical protein